MLGKHESPLAGCFFGWDSLDCSHSQDNQSANSLCQSMTVVARRLTIVVPGKRCHRVAAIFSLGMLFVDGKKRLFAGFH